MLDLVEKRYQDLASELIEETDVANKKINPMRQTHAIDQKDKKKKIQLDHPLYRCTLPYDEKKKQVGTSFKGQFKPIVSYHTKEIKPVFLETNLDNCGDLITYLSLVGGSITFEKLIISSMGISISIRVRSLIVKTHPKLENQAVTQEEYEELDTLGSFENDSDSDSDSN